MMRRILTGLLIGGCFEALVMSQEIQLGNQPIVFGEAFELTVIADATFDPDLLSPLEANLLEQTPAGGLVRWRFRARCYEIGVVVLATDPPFQLSVASSLPDATNPEGALEWPSQGWLIEESAGGTWLFLGLSLFVGFIGLLWWRSSHTTTVAKGSLDKASSEPWDVAAALRELSELQDDDEAFYQTLKAIVRRHCSVHFHLPASVRTSEELVAALPSAITTLGPCLTSCDVAMFGGEAYRQNAPETARTFAKMFLETSQYPVGSS